MLRKLLIIVIFSICSVQTFAEFSPKGDVGIRECGSEARYENGQLKPIAILYPMHLNMKCKDCEIKFTFDVPDKSGNPNVSNVEYSGMSKEHAEFLQGVFEAMVFLHCTVGGSTRGFKNEVYVYTN